MSPPKITTKVYDSLRNNSVQNSSGKSAEASGLKACRVAPSQRSTSSLLTQGEVYLSPFPLGPSGSAPQTSARAPPPTFATRPS